MNSTSNKAASQHKKGVRQDTTQHTRLNDANLSFFQCYDADLQGLILVSGKPDVTPKPTMSSTALPNVAFSRPPKVSPNFMEISSVANERMEANGMIAKKLSVKMTTGSQCVRPATIPSGTKINRTLT